jgi:hypothetical protein
MASKVTSTVVLLSILGLLCARAAHADDPIRNWWHDSGHDPGWGKPCQVSLEAKDGISTKVVKCAKGVEMPWAGDWKDEFWDGPCKVKLEARRDVFKSEVNCHPH